MFTSAGTSLVITFFTPSDCEIFSWSSSYTVTLICQPLPVQHTVGLPLATSSAPRATVAGSAFSTDQGFCDRSDRCTPDESVLLRYHAGVRSGFAWTLVLSVVVQMSHPQPPSVEALGYCGCQPGFPSVILPSRMMGASDRQLVHVL